jgi:hypothetical protein
VQDGNQDCREEDLSDARDQPRQRDDRPYLVAIRSARVLVADTEQQQRDSEWRQHRAHDDAAKRPSSRRAHVDDAAAPAREYSQSKCTFQAALSVRDAAMSALQ